MANKIYKHPLHGQFLVTDKAFMPTCLEEALKQLGFRIYGR